MPTTNYPKLFFIPLLLLAFNFGGLTQTQCILSVTTTHRNITCNGNNDGQITAEASRGSGQYFYLWSNGSTGATISGLKGGSYTVTVTGEEWLKDKVYYRNTEKE